MTESPDERARLRDALAIDALEQRAAAARIGGALFGADAVATSPRLGSYVLLERVGAGAHGVVWSAYHLPTRRQVALKILGRASSRDDAKNEARALARANHPHVVAVFEIGAVDDRSFIAMEWVAPRTLVDWLAESPRSRREILAIFAQAARGLHAAHTVGVVHRDFKPANVLVGDDGRARVGDFGLAVADPGSAPTCAGTPAYMSPEQHRGEQVDARSDQFAFFVALHEALVGRRPFVGADIASLRAAILAGARDAAPGLPPALERGLAKGLSVDARLRHTDMLGVAQWLEAMTRSRSRLGLWAAVPVMVVALASVAQVGGTPRPGCDSVDTARARLLPAETRAQVVAAIDHAAPALDDPGRRVGERLDEWVTQWATLQHSTCSAAIVDDTMMCLRTAEGDFRALVDVLASADATVARNATDAVLGLDRPEHCGLGLHARTEVSAEVSEPLAKVEALRAAGKPAQALALAEQTLEHVRERGRPVDAVATAVAFGRAAEDAGEFDLAVTTLADAYVDAYGMRADALAAAAATRLVYVEGYMLERTARGRTWGRAVEAMHAERGLADHDAPEIADLLANLGAVADAAGEHDVALARSLEALHMRERLYVAPHPDIARAYNNIGVVLVGLGRHADALAAHEQALAQRRELHGEQHPSVATSLHNLGFVHLRGGDIARAAEQIEAAFAIREATLGAWHPDVASSWGAIATVREARGDHDGAHAAIVRAIAIGERVWGRDHARVHELHVRAATFAATATRETAR